MSEVNEMREIKRIVVHHTGREKGTAESIRSYHVDVLGWRDIGYHYIIEKDGKLRLGRPDEMIGAHVKGKNRDSIGVAVMGNYEDYEFVFMGYFMASPQARALYSILKDLAHRYPDAEVVTHGELAETLCPGQNVQAWIDKWR